MTNLVRKGILALAIGIGAGSALIGTAQADEKGPWNDWMKANLVPAKRDMDKVALKKGLNAVKAANPDKSAFPKWDSITDDGLKAAEAGDKDALNKSCTACHNAYKKTFKEKYRGSPPPK
jgi:hypothetical protein